MENLLSSIKFLFLYNRGKGAWQECRQQATWMSVNKEGIFLIRFFGGQTLYHYSEAEVRFIKEGARLWNAPKYGMRGGNASFFRNSRDKRIYVIEDGYLRIYSEETYRLFLARCQEQKRHMQYYALLSAYEEPEGCGGLLTKQYDELDEDDAPLLRALEAGKATSFDAPPLYFPFSFNQSQIQAVKNALSSNFSIIQGPPGTGKTQTILNLLANLVIEGKKVAVISNNNEAIFNIREKMEKAGYGGIVATLGSRENKEAFFSTIKNKNAQTRKKEAARQEKELSEAVSYRLFRLQESFLLRKKLSQVNDEIFALSAPSSLPAKEKEKTTDLFRKPSYATSENAVDLMSYLEKAPKESTSFFRRLVLFFRYHLRFSSARKPLAVLYEEVRGFYLTIRQQELEEERQGYLQKISQEERLTQEVISLSKTRLDQAASSLNHSPKNFPFTLDDFRRRFSFFLSCYPILLSSSYSLATSIPKGTQLDYLILDEASQSTISTILPCLQFARNMVVLGDDKQLSPVQGDLFRAKEKELAEEKGIPEDERDDGKSFLSYLEKKIPSIPTMMLVEHYRSQRDIIEFSNERFYHSSLQIETKPTEGKHLKMIVTAPGHHARRNSNGGRGLYNLREIEEIKLLLPSLQGRDVGIIAPYVRQRELLQQEVGDKAEVGTIHSFQGREKDVIILSLTANNAEEYRDQNDELRKAFIDNPRLINVAMTRAENLFVLVTSDEIAHEKTGILADLVGYLSYRTGTLVEEGKVHSLFDALYLDREKRGKESLPKSEELFKKMLTHLLSQKEFSSLSFAMHVVLKDFLKIDEGDWPEETYRYLNTPWTHVDFLVYRKVSHRPLVAFEVDGVAFHEQREKQKIHDEWKDEAFRKAGLPLLRFPTNGSQEERRVTEALRGSLSGN